MVPSGQRREPGPEVSKCGLPKAAGFGLDLPLLTRSPGASALQASSALFLTCLPPRA